MATWAGTVVAGDLAVLTPSQGLRETNPLPGTVFLEIGGGGAPPVSAPITAIISPSPGTTIGRSTPLIFTVTGTVPLRRVIVTCSYAELLPEEVVHNGDAFAPTFVGPTNVRAAITGGYQYTILRDGGWPGSPRLNVYAIDTQGYE